MKVLIVEDDKVTRLVLSRILSDQGYQVTACATGEEAVWAYGLNYYPLLFLDLFLPGMDGFALCRWVRTQKDGDRHFILVGTASDRRDDLEKILEAGADDYITKPYHADSLKVRLIIAQQRMINIEIRKALEADLTREREHLSYLATHDSLTHLLNRAAFLEELHISTRAAAEEGSTHAVVFVDLDNFKMINDSLGHHSGDRALSEVASLIKESVRTYDMAARLGGDEFVILLRNIQLREAKIISERMVAQIKKIVYSDPDKSIVLGASAGIALVDGTADSDVDMACADSACYVAKMKGRNRVEMYTMQDESIAERQHKAPRAAQVKEAILEKSFEVFFQPVVDLETALPVFFEVLLRLPSQGELLLPRAFLPVAERFHLMSELDRQVITMALTHLAANNDLHLSINLSGQSFADEGLLSFIESSFQAANVEPFRTIFEITETAVISNLGAAQAIIKKLRRFGFQFALDDFGAGFSSFGYLKDLTVDYLKIDGDFIREAESDESKWIFVEMVNDFAHRLKIRSIAEFVENESTARRIQDIGVDLAQGHFFAEAGILASFRPSETRSYPNRKLAGIKEDAP